MEDPKDTRWGRFLNFRIQINLHLLLKREILVKVKNNISHWVYFKYKPLPIFCYNFGCCSQSMKNCEKTLEDDDDDIKCGMQYGD